MLPDNHVDGTGAGDDWRERFCLAWEAGVEVLGGLVAIALGLVVLGGLVAIVSSLPAVTGIIIGTLGVVYILRR